MTESKMVARAPRVIEGVVRDVTNSLMDGKELTEDARRWSYVDRRPSSMFDHREVIVMLNGSDLAETATIEVEIVFDASASRAVLISGMAASLVGIPFGAAWRWQSIRAAKAEAQSMFASMWKGLDRALAAGHAYR